MHTACVIWRSTFWVPWNSFVKSPLYPSNQKQDVHKSGPDIPHSMEDEEACVHCKSRISSHTGIPFLRRNVSAFENCSQYLLMKLNPVIIKKPHRPGVAGAENTLPPEDSTNMGGNRRAKKHAALMLWNVPGFSASSLEFGWSHWVAGWPSISVLIFHLIYFAVGQGGKMAAVKQALRNKISSITTRAKTES